MPWAFLVWLLCFCLQAALVGFAFYVLIQLYDFEEDLMNTFDCAKRCNRIMSPEIIVQAAVLLLSIAGGHFVAALLNLAGLGLLGFYYSRGKLLLDAQELWKQLPKAKQFTYFRLAAYGTAFAFTMFRLIEMVVHELLSDHGRFMLREALRDTIHI